MLVPYLLRSHFLALAAVIISRLEDEGQGELLWLFLVVLVDQFDALMLDEIKILRHSMGER